MGGMDALDQGAFVVALEGLEVDTDTICHARQRQIDVRQRHLSVVFWLTGAKQIEIRPVNYQNSRFLDWLGSGFLLLHSRKFAADRRNLSRPIPE